MSRTLIIAPPPTPNGDLHVGHLAGPYLAGDVYARYLRANDRAVLYATGTDDSQTYVVISAHKLGVTPETLSATAARDIQATLQTCGIQVDGFAPFDERYREAVRAFLWPLFTQGKLEWRTVPLPFCERRQQFMVEGLVTGQCPVCLNASRGGLCEACGHPNNFGELRDAHATIAGDAPLTLREARILVFPLERYRAPLEAYYQRQQGRWRPHLLQLVRELLDRPLPDFPITYPVTWGIPSPFPGSEGQVLNAWVEGMPASMYCSTVAAEAHGERPASFDDVWRHEHAARLVYFLGFDNSYFWGVVHLALLMAHDGRYVLPDVIVPNEFYELEHEKFSTSRGHLIWARDFVREVPRDLARFYLALTSPEHHRTNFSRAGLHKLTHDRLLSPWAALCARLEPLRASSALPVSDAGRSDGARMLERFEACYTLETFSLTRLADTISQQLTRLERLASSALDTASPEAHGDLWHQVRLLLHCAAPLLCDVGAALPREAARSWSVLATADHVVPFNVPELSALTVPV